MSRRSSTTGQDHLLLTRSYRLPDVLDVRSLVLTDIGRDDPLNEDIGAANVRMTAELAQAGGLLDIELLDHLIIGDGRWVSRRRLGLGFPSGNA